MKKLRPGSSWILRMLVLLLCATLITPVLAACTDGEKPDDTEQTAGGSEAGETTAAAPPETDYVNDDLPDSLNYGNGQFDFLAWTQSTVEYFSEPEGDNINNAVYTRNMAVEERLGVKLNFTVRDGNSSTFNEFCTTASNSILSNTGEFDAIACYSRSAGVLTSKGVLVNLLETEHLNFEKPWWPESLLANNTIGDKLYFMSGDIATSLIYQLTFLIVNCDLLSDLSLENPQSLVGSGEWTVDKLIAMCKDSYADLDTDGKKSVGDRLGLVISNHPLMDLFFIGSGITYVNTGTDGSMVLSDSYFTDKTYTLIDKLNALLWETDDAMYSRDFNKTNMAVGNSLFYDLIGSTLASYEFRNAEFEYSILPAPKYDAAQENYYTAIGFVHSMYCIPTDAENRDKSSAVMECMASESYRTVTPALFDTAFKYKYANSPLDADMFEIIRSGVVFDIGRAFFDALGGDATSPIRTLRQQLEGNINNLASSGSKYKKVWQNSLGKIYEAILELPD